VAERPSQEDLLEQMKQLRVSDILLDLSMSLVSLGFLRHLDQARLATDALRALLPLLKERVPEDLSRDLSQALANLQLAYAKAAAEQPAGGGEGAAETPAAEAEAGPSEAAPATPEAEPA
jgi:hypothetical protein